MIYGSVCSGIEAASAAWHPLGWRPAFFSEIEAFPRAVLAHRYPSVALHGDFTTIQDGDYAVIDVLVGGTPCQSFSVAGLRAGLGDERGNLALEFCRLARRLGPRWVVWENVPGVLSLDGGRAFASILGGLAECGYGLAYRVLDAQFVRIDGFGRAVPQRRRRVFVVGCLGDWRRAAAVLFERASLCGHPPPRRQAGQGTAPTLSARTRGGGGLGTDFECDGGLTPVALAVSGTLNANGKAAGSSTQQDAEAGMLLPIQVHGAHGSNGAGIGEIGDPMMTLQAGVSHGVAVCFDETQITSATNRCQPQAGETDHPLAAGARPPTIAFNWNAQPDQMNFDGHTTPTLSCSQGAAALIGWRVRRLTPTECERLQGFPDGYTAIPYRGKPAADGPRYKALGNSMAVNCMRWIGRRIEMVEAIQHPIAEAAE